MSPYFVIYTVDQYDFWMDQRVILNAVSYRIEN